tara:strand:- start:51082 stop:51429 length:348 start_codon:yes stop_codon:yes gene_type:complete
MKTIFTLLVSITLLSISVAASGPKKVTEYFICHFTDSITSTHLTELEKEGFQVFETNSHQRVIYVKAKDQAEFTTHLKTQMRKLIKVTPNGEEVNLIRTGVENSPQFLKLFFNFI